MRFLAEAYTMNSTSSLKFDVVIAGGGFAGVYCARALARELGEEAERRVALISDQNFMVFQPMLAEVAGSALSPRHVVNPIRRLCRHVTVLRGSISAIDVPAQQLFLQASDYTEGVTVGFEHLVIALGGIVDLSRVPGMPEHAYLMKNVGDALRLRGAVIDRFEEANVETQLPCQRRLLTFVIVGGGYSGVETAGQILDLAKEMLEYYPRIPEEALKVVLVHSGQHLLPEINPSLGAYCEENLRSRGVELILGARVTTMTAGRVTFGDGRSLETHTVVSTVGNAPHPLITQLCKDGHIECVKGRIITEPTLRVQGQTRLWSAGDCAAVPMYVKPKKEAAADAAPSIEKLAPSPFEPRPFCPPTAQFAVRQGELLGRNLVCALRGSDSLDTFKFTGLGELAAIGHHAAVAEVFGCKFSGFFAWWLWRSIYLMKLPGIERKLRVLMEWTLDLFFPRDIALFQPKPTQILEEMFLEKGDTVVRAGEPALSLYVVKSGQMEIRDSKGQVLRTLVKGEQLGKRTILSGQTWPFDAVAAEPTTLVAISARLFEAVADAGAPVEQIFSRPANVVRQGEPSREDAVTVP